MGIHAAPDHLRIGILTTIPHDGGPSSTVDLVCCIHCGYIFQFGPQKTKGRGWCMKCNGYLCGRKYCRGQVPCRHWMHGIDAMEKGQPNEAAAPITVSVPRLILGKA